MKLDKDGFMDMTWCRRKLVPSFHELREIIGHANKRKCISPTQFNWCSTRGHCILEFEVTNAISGSRGRLYVCDLAGAEPAADIHYAKYCEKLTQRLAVRSIFTLESILIIIKHQSCRHKGRK